MITFKSIEDLKKLYPSHPAYLVTQACLHYLIKAYTTPNHPYRANECGYLVLVEPEEDVIDLPELQGRLTSIPWEGVMKHDGFYYAIHLTNNQFGIGFLIPDSVTGDLRNLLEELVSS